MNALRTLGAEIVGLFIEDRFFALAVALWLAFIAILTPTLLSSSPLARGLALFGGLAAILIASVIYGARKP